LTASTQHRWQHLQLIIAITEQLDQRDLSCLVSLQAQILFVSSAITRWLFLMTSHYMCMVLHVLILLLFN